MDKRNKVEFLTHYKSTWLNNKTTTVRVPIVFKDEIINYARHRDNDNMTYEDLLIMYETLKDIKSKLETVNGYKRNNSGMLIKQLKKLIKE